MRLWSIHPEYLDAKGLVALWREGLLAQKILQGKTKGYRNHPQLDRFKDTYDPLGAISTYLRYIAKEASLRSYNFDTSKIVPTQTDAILSISDGQVEYEFQHLLAKLKMRAPDRYQLLHGTKVIRTHPMFAIYQGDVEKWEIVKDLKYSFSTSLPGAANQ